MFCRRKFTTDEDRYFLDCLAYITWFCTFFSVVLLCWHVSIRVYLDLQVEWLSLLPLVSMWLATCYSIFALPESILHWFVSRRHFIPFIPLAIVVLPLLNAVIGSSIVYVFLPIGIVGFTGLLRHSNFSRKEWFKLITIALFFGSIMFLFCTQQLSYVYKHHHFTAHYVPSFAKELAALGVAFLDNYSEAAIIHMSQSWHRLSMGIDGLHAPGFPGHIASYAWYAAMGQITHTPPFTAMPMSFLGLLFPAIIFIFFLNLICVRKTLPDSPFFYIMSALTVVTFADIIRPEMFAEMMTATFSCALLVFLAALPYLYVTVQRVKIVFSAESFLYFLSLFIISCLIGICRLHAGAIYLAAAAFLLAGHYIKNRTVQILLVPAFLIGITVLRHIVFADSDLNDGKFNMIESANIIFSQGWAYYLPAFFYFTVLRQPLSSRFYTSEHNVQSTWIDQWIRFCLAMSIFPYIFPGGWNTMWFGSVVYWNIVMLICMHPHFELSYLCERMDNSFSSLKKFLSGAGKCSNAQFTFSIVLFISAINIAYNVHNLSLAWENNIALIRTYARITPTLLEQATHLISLQRPKDTTFAVFVPQNNNDFWAYGDRCISRSYYIPAFAGVPMLIGMPPQNEECTSDYKLGPRLANTEFGAYAMASNQSDKEICAHARLRKIEHIFLLNDMTEPTKNKLLNCNLPMFDDSNERQH